MTEATLPPRVVIWHDAECGGYRADLPLWRGLAAAEGDPVLDVGAGTGRVALDLAARGHDVTALDRDPELLCSLAGRPGGDRVRTAVADAEAFDLGGARFGLILVPMQTVQLLGDRPAFLACARRHLRPGGLLAAALADDLDDFDAETSILPAPDRADHGGWRFASQPVAVRVGPTHSTIERIRTVLGPDGERSAEGDAIALAHLSVEQLEAEGRAAGFAPEPARRIEPTEEHVGSGVVLLRG